MSNKYSTVFFNSISIISQFFTTILSICLKFATFYTIIKLSYIQDNLLRKGIGHWGMLEDEAGVLGAFNDFMKHLYKAN